MLKIAKLALVLAIFCVISAASLSFVYLLTQPVIDFNRFIAYESSVKEVLAGQKGEAIKVSPQGYAGPIEMLVGISESGSVTGGKILVHKETPGLGAKVAGPNFLTQFIGKTLASKLVPKDDIDAITGATISSRAVCQGVREALSRRNR